MFSVICQFKHQLTIKKSYREAAGKRFLICIKQIRTGLVFILLTTFAVSCEKSGDYISIAPYKEVGVIKDLTGSMINGKDVYLTWGMPDGKDLHEEMIKGFIIYVSPDPDGVAVEDRECLYEPVDFISASTKPNQLHKNQYEYIKKNLKYDDQIWLYKVVVMYKNNKIGKDSNVISVQGEKH